ncbi:hypothetical protein [Propionivibrio sp.]
MFGFDEFLADVRFVIVAGLGVGGAAFVALLWLRHAFNKYFNK